MKVDLETLSLSCTNPNQLGTYNNVIEPKTNKYEEGKCAHEAGYDSYITGLAFVCMCNFLNSAPNIEIKNKKKEKK